MQVHFSRNFKKSFQKLQPRIQQQFAKRLDLFIQEPNHPQLQNHPLKGHMIGYRAFAVSGDYHVIYQIIDAKSIKLVDIGRHSQVYK
ncbi:MAG: hypothetical protein A2788_01325 [Candidatus Abawacabacteria bacterium RIFCSPHIGHO2_01_FULL_46_8]|uniref:Addiction module toxin RelE n=1 Tax=Candidatus Abawacabacteria bacterium RIFCSPHIGHO2_01_FULL_46_8 TaxID=1817815 RepID=A0A1F4XM55_9BACT|nr:MAG: hypothetical protein A2788_01325 [Candidatus Abawacabacteria bacterium RIFCSPHIGHO2_01_FULL_46_8]